jgi:Family of unknown function (DUF6318)
VTRDASPTATTGSPIPTAESPTAPATTTSTPTAADTATTPLLTGAAVLPGEVPPTPSSYENHDDASGALAFAAYFYKALDWSIATTNPNLLRPISAPSCSACQYYIQRLDGLAADGAYSTGARGHVIELMVTTGAAVKADVVVKVTLVQQPGVIFSPGAAPVTYPPAANPTINYLYMSWRDSRWEAIQITRP